LLLSLFIKHYKINILWRMGRIPISGMAGDGLPGGTGGKWQGFSLSLRKFLGFAEGDGVKKCAKISELGRGAPKRDAGLLTGKKEHPVKNAQMVSFGVREWVESGSRKY
jgi:hypothetical protein